MRGIEDKVIILTGGARNIGQVYARRLAEEGAKVVVCDMRDCEETAEIIRSQGGEVLPLRVDVSDEAQTLEMARLAFERFGRIDGLVNNAALFKDLGADGVTGFMDVDMDRWDQTFAVNVRGPFLCIRAVFPYMRDSGGGKIVNIGSGVFLHSSRGRTATNPHYVSSKAGVMGLTSGHREGAGRAQHQGQHPVARQHRRDVDARHRPRLRPRRRARAKPARDSGRSRGRRGLSALAGERLHHGADDLVQRRERDSLAPPMSPYRP